MFKITKETFIYAMCMLGYNLKGVTEFADLVFNSREEISDAELKKGIDLFWNIVREKDSMY